MIIEKLALRQGVAFLAEDDGQVLAEVYFDAVAQLFAASDDMFDLLKMFIEAHVIEDSQLMRVAVGEAQKLVERVEK